MTAAGSGAQGEGVSGVEAQEVVVGVTEEVEQHLDGQNGNNTLWKFPLFKGFLFLLASSSMNTFPDLASMG